MLFRSIGKLVYMENIEVSKGDNVSQLLVQPWDAGVYFMEVFDGVRFFKDRFIKSY